MSINYLFEDITEQDILNELHAYGTPEDNVIPLTEAPGNDAAAITADSNSTVNAAGGKDSIATEDVGGLGGSLGGAGGDILSGGMSGGDLSSGLLAGGPSAKKIKKITGNTFYYWNNTMEIQTKTTKKIGIFIFLSV